MQIKKKTDVTFFLEQFHKYAEWDEVKHYLTIPWEHNGTITLMLYRDELYTYHRKNDLFWDVGEVMILNIDRFIWNHRKWINQALKEVHHANHIK